MDNEIANNIVQLEADQPLINLEPAVVTSYTQIKEHFRLWKRKDNNKMWKRVNCYRQAKAFIDEEQSNRWTAGLL